MTVTTQSLEAERRVDGSPRDSYAAEGRRTGQVHPTWSCGGRRLSLGAPPPGGAVNGLTLHNLRPPGASWDPEDRSSTSTSRL